MQTCVALALALGLGCTRTTEAPQPPPPAPAPTAPVEASAPPPEPATLLTATESGGSCALEVVRVPDGAHRVLATAKGSCPHSLLFTPDGKRIFDADGAFGIDLDPPGSRPLPKLEPPSREGGVEDYRGLHVDAQGAPFWEVTWGFGEPTEEGEGLTSYPKTVQAVFALERVAGDGASWTPRAEVASDGDEAAKAKYREARRPSEVAASFSTSVGFDDPKVADPAAREALDAASGAHPDHWDLSGPVAIGAEFGEGEVLMGPALLRVGDRWTVLTAEARGALSVAVEGRWVVVSVGTEPAHAYDATTGRELWSGPHDAMFWPDKVPSPTL